MKYIKQKYLAFVFATIPFVFTTVCYLQSCKPATPPSGIQKDTPVLAIPQVLKDYCYFKLGSYWIMQDSISGAYDTIRVVAHWNDSGLMSVEGKIYYFERMKVKMSTSYDGYFTELSQIYGKPPHLPEMGQVLIDRYKSGDVKCGMLIYNRFPYIVNEKLNDTYSVYLRHSNDSLKIYEWGTYHCYDDRMAYEIQKKNIGVIRRETREKGSGDVKAVWKLTEYFLIQ